MNKLPVILGVLVIITAIFAWMPQKMPESTSTDMLDKILGKESEPEQVADLQVATWDDTLKAPKVFQVKKEEGKWIIPSHHGYPADGGSRVGKTSGGVLNVKRGRPVSEDPKQFADLGVVDPMSEGTESTGRGKRVTVKDQAGGVLIDLIVGNKAKDADDMTNVREANSNAVFLAKVNADISTQFIDWVEADLLKVARDDILSITILDSSVDEEKGIVQTRSETGLRREGSTADWTSPQAPEGMRPKKEEVDKLLDAVTGIRLAGIRPFNMGWLQQRGFYLNTDQAVVDNPESLVLNDQSGKKLALVGNEGSMVITTKDGLRYKLFYGEIALGDEEDKDAESTKGKEKKTGEGHNRYMAVFAQYDAKVDQNPAPAANPDKPDEKPADPAGKTKADKAQKRFERFFYVVSDSTFLKLRPTAETLWEEKPKDEPKTDNKAWLEENGKKPGITTTASGLQYEVISSGKGKGKQPTDADKVSVHYKGTLTDGAEFDASTGAPVEFGVTQVIKGWTEALKLMREGDKWKLYIPPEIGYGEAGSPPKIGPNAILVFEVELVKVVK
jgi:FKBP-type peptidyl-prolyl cis-trans isomerase FklB